MQLVPRPPWHDDAACTGQTEVMFGDDEASAKALCATCTVRPPCLAAALAQHEPWGIWGGFTAGERRRITAATPEQLPGVLRQIATAQRSSRLAAS